MLTFPYPEVEEHPNDLLPAFYVLDQDYSCGVQLRVL